MEQPSIRSYRIRGSRITDAQASARARLGALYEIPVTQEILNLPALFPDSRRIIMEIGFGMGEATAYIAEHQPEDGFVAVEIHPPGIGKLLALIEEKNLKNVKIIPFDVHVIIEHMIADRSLDGIHLFFPDPWPKKKHHKRRIVNKNFLELIAPKLVDGGFIHIATDWVPYAEWTEDVFATTDLFTGGVVDRPDWRPVTRFEGQGLNKDHRVTDLRYFKN